MKKTMLCISAITLLLLFACSNNDSSTSPTGFPDTNEEGSFDVFDYFISFNSGVQLFSSSEVNSCIFKLNNIEIDTDWFYDEDEDELFYPGDGWWCLFDLEELPEEIDLVHGSEITYYLRINGKTFSGTIMYPSELEVNWPEFNINEDFIFSWTLQENTDIQFVNMSVGDYSNSDEQLWELPNYNRNYTILENNFQGYNESELWIDVGLYCINYRNHGKCLIISSTHDYFYIYKDKLSPNRLNRKKIILRIIKEINLK